MPRIVIAMCLLVLAAVGMSCGSPPPPLTGTISYTYGCAMTSTNPVCEGGAVFLTGAPNSGNPPLDVVCHVSPRASGGVHVWLQIIRSATTPDQGSGIQICGDVAGAGQNLTAGKVSFYDITDTDSAVGLSTPGICNVTINTLPTDTMTMNPGVTGQLSCMNAPGSAETPPRLFFVAGVTGTNATQNPALADFSFAECDTVMQPCM